MDIENENELTIIRHEIRSASLDWTRGRLLGMLLVKERGIK